MEYFERCRCGHAEPDHSAFGTCGACIECEDHTAREHAPRPCTCRGFVAAAPALAYGT